MSSFLYWHNRTLWRLAAHSGHHPRGAAPTAPSQYLLIDNKVRRLKIHRGWLQKRKHLNEKLISKILLKVMGTISYFSGCPWYLEWTMSTLYPSPHQGCPTWSFTRLYFYVATIFLHDLLLVLLSSYWNTKSRTSLSLSKIEAKIRISHGFRRSNEICMHKTNHGTW